MGGHGSFAPTTDRVENVTQWSCGLGVVSVNAVSLHARTQRAFTTLYFRSTGESKNDCFARGNSIAEVRMPLEKAALEITCFGKAHSEAHRCCYKLGHLGKVAEVLLA